MICCYAAIWKTKKDRRGEHKDGTSGKQTEIRGGGRNCPKMCLQACFGVRNVSLSHSITPFVYKIIIFGHVVA
jgi:hypothetical protein